MRRTHCETPSQKHQHASNSEDFHLDGCDVLDCSTFETHGCNVKATPTMAKALMQIAEAGRLPVGQIPIGTAQALVARRIVAITGDSDPDSQCRWLELTDTGSRRIGAALAMIGGGR